MYIVRISIVVTLLVVDNAFASDYLCFSVKQYPAQRICYDQGAVRSKNIRARKRAVELFNNLDRPGNRLLMSPELSVLYTQDQFNARIRKYHGAKSVDDISWVVSSGDYSAVLLNSGEVLVYDHLKQAFIFGFDGPVPLLGATRSYVLGGKPTKEVLPEKQGSCDLKRENIIYLSESKQSQYYKSGENYCSWGGLAIMERDDELKTVPDGWDGSALHVNQSNAQSMFILWMKKGRVIEYARFEDIKDIPSDVRRFYASSGCMVPQVPASSMSQSRPNLPFSGDFDGNGSVDWVALCSREGVSALVVKWGSPSDCPSELESDKDDYYYEKLGGDGKEYFTRQLLEVRKKIAQLRSVTKPEDIEIFDCIKGQWKSMTMPSGAQS